VSGGREEGEKKEGKRKRIEKGDKKETYHIK
jgi:hypothetical protein